MGIRSKLFLCLVLWLLLAVEVSAQEVVGNVEEEELPKGLMGSTIEDAIAKSLFQAGAFWIQPKLNVFSAYDSNSLLLSTDVVDDLTIQADPGVVASLPFRDRALLQIEDEVNFIYYRDTEDLRGVFNTVGARFTIGGNRVLFTIADTYQFRRTRPSQEFDFPTDQRSNNFDSSLMIGLGRKSEAVVGVQSTSTDIATEIVNPTDTPLSQFYDEDTFRVIGGFRRHVSEFTTFLFNSYYEKWDFADLSLQPDADIFGVEGGFSFAAKGNITGQAVLGYKNMVPEVEGEPEFSGLVGLGSVNFRVGERTILGLSYSRSTPPSIVENNWFFIESRVAPNIEFYITREISVFALVAFEKNSYVEPSLIVTPTGELVPGEIDDSAIDSIVAVRFRVARIWQVFVSGTRLNRDSNAPNSDKERNVIGAGVQLAF